MSWTFLYIAILLEVCGTLLLKQSDGFTRPLFAIASLGFYSISFYVLARAFRIIDVGVAYAIWSALGTTLVMIVGIILWKEPISLVRIFWIAVIIIGVVGLQLHSRQLNI